MKRIKKEKDNLKKNNYIGYIFLLIIIIIFTIVLLIYNSNTSKIKRYLTNKNYECNKVECTKILDNYRYIIPIDTLNFKATSDIYNISVDDQEILLEKRSDKTSCVFTSTNYSKTKLVDETYLYTVYCQEYIKDVNKVLKDYHNILKESKVKIDNQKSN